MLKMLSLNYNDKSFIKLVGNSLYDGHDHLVKSNINNYENIEILILLDSRGISRSYENSLAQKLVNYFSESKFLILVRPLELTVWPTLYNIYL